MLPSPTSWRGRPVRLGNLTDAERSEIGGVLALAVAMAFAAGLILGALAMLWLLG